MKHPPFLRFVITQVILILSLGACGVPSPAPTPKAALPTVTPTDRPLLPATPAPPTKTPIQIVGVPPAGELYQGTYPGGVTGEEDDITIQGLRSFEGTVGKAAAWVYFSDNWYRSRRFPTETATWIRAAGSVPFIRLMMRSDANEDHAEPTFTLQRIINGDFDADLHAWASDARAFGTPLLVEFGTEVNGEWFPWNGIWNGGGTSTAFGDLNQPDGPERFRDAYRHIITIARQEGATNIQWVFHVNNADSPDVDWNHLENYYPGNDWIDWIGVSAYGALTPMDDDWPSFRGEMDAVYPRVAALSPDKPIVVLEFGTAARNPLGNQAEWAQAALSDLISQRWPRIIGFSWWNEFWENDSSAQDDTTMRVQDNPDLAKVFQQLVGQNAAVVGKAVLVNR